MRLSTSATSAKEQKLKICVVGSGTHFLSGISYYTHRLANAMAHSHPVSVILMRQLLPTRFYPGRQRVGQALTKLQYNPAIKLFDGIDWYWLPSMWRGLRFLRQEHPDVIVLQWWSGTVLHSYLALALAARLSGSQLVIEFHEVLDTAEARLPLVGNYVRFMATVLVKLAAGFVVHSEYDLPRLQQHYQLGDKPVAIIPHGPYDQYQTEATPASELVAQTKLVTELDKAACNFLFFGTIRPYKGLEDLIHALNTIPAEEIDQYHLTIVGETWEGWNLPAQLIEESPYRDRITFVNRYVNDTEVAQFFAEADAVVLPYHRSSASGPLHIAMSQGLPLLVTEVGGLPEVVADYAGALVVPPENPESIRAGMAQMLAMRGKRFEDPHSWEHTVTRYDGLFEQLTLKNKLESNITEVRNNEQFSGT